MTNRLGWVVLAATFAAACSKGDSAELARLRSENARLRADLATLQATPRQGGGPGAPAPGADAGARPASCVGAWSAETSGVSGTPMTLTVTVSGETAAECGVYATRFSATDSNAWRLTECVFAPGRMAASGRAPGNEPLSVALDCAGDTASLTTRGHATRTVTLRRVDPATVAVAAPPARRPLAPATGRALNLAAVPRGTGWWCFSARTPTAPPDDPSVDLCSRQRAECDRLRGTQIDRANVVTECVQRAAAHCTSSVYERRPMATCSSTRETCDQWRADAFEENRTSTTLVSRDISDCAEVP